MPEIFGEPMKLAGFSGCGKGDDPEPSGAPVNTQQASFAPLPPREGDTVEANEGQWSSDTPITYTYQWQLGGVDIVGATLKTLLILPEMTGLALRCVVTAVNAAGSAISATVSAAVEIVNYVAFTNGSSQFWQLSSPVSIPSLADFEIDVNLNGTEDSFEGVFEGENIWLRLLPSSQSNNFQGKVADTFFSAIPSDQATVRNGTTRSIRLSRDSSIMYLSLDSEPRVEVVTYGGSLSIERLSVYSTAEFKGFIKNFSVSVSGVVISEIPLTNKSQGALQLATVGTINATMIGYDPSVWIDESTL